MHYTTFSQYNTYREKCTPYATFWPLESPGFDATSGGLFLLEWIENQAF